MKGLHDRGFIPSRASAFHLQPPMTQSLPLTGLIHEINIHEVFVKGLLRAMRCSKSWDTTESKTDKDLFPRSLDSSGRDAQFIYKDKNR